MGTAYSNGRKIRIDDQYSDATLTLSKEELDVLYLVIASVGGEPDSSLRKISNQILRKVENYCEIANNKVDDRLSLREGNIHFKEDSLREYRLLMSKKTSTLKFEL